MSREQKRKSEKRVHHNFHCKKMSNRCRLESMKGSKGKHYKAQGFAITPNANLD